jgi:hypothetical protein
MICMTDFPMSFLVDGRLDLPKQFRTHYSVSRGVLHTQVHGTKEMLTKASNELRLSAPASMWRLGG